MRVRDLLRTFFGRNVQARAAIGKKRPALSLTLWEKETGRRAKLVIPPREAPLAIRSLKQLGLWDKPPISSSSLRPELSADYDDAHRLVLTPRYQNGESSIAASDVERGLVRGTRWYWSGETFHKVAAPPKAISDFFDPDAKLVYEGEEIREFLGKKFEELLPLVAFKPSARVKASKGGPRAIGAVKIEAGGRDWLQLDLAYSPDRHAAALAEILKAQEKAKYVRQGDAFVPVEPAPEAVPARSPAEKPRAPREATRRFEIRPEDVPEPTPAPLPQGLRSGLRSYQKRGFDWLWWLKSSNLGGVLADDMGLGKTHQTMALLAAVYEGGARRPTLIVTPASVLDQWYRKIREHAPTLMPYVHHGPARLTSADDFAPLRVVLTTFSLVVRDLDLLSEVDWEYVVLDEAHMIKTSGTRTAWAAKRLKAAARLALTGTPLENRPGELWSLFDFVMPGYLGSLEKFRERYEIPIVKNHDAAALSELRRKIAPLKLRRLKEEVLQELPPKQEDRIYVEMTPEQEALYRGVCEKRSAKLLEELADNTRPVDYIHVFAVLTRLKQICDHPALVLEHGGERLASGKFEALKELLDRCLGCDQKVVVFSQYVQMLKIVEQHLRERGIGYSALVGSTRDRGEVVRGFEQDPLKKVFLASLLAGGTGIDLQAASVVIHFDRWWNAAKEEQATDRCHRIGQKRPVQVWKLITRRTVEEKIDGLISAKAKMFDSIVETESDFGSALGRQELIELLGGMPLRPAAG